jgi:hypothetical protein
MEDAEVRWIDCNIGSPPHHEIPRRHHEGRKRARGEVISIALANTGQHQDTGAKMIHAADDTTSNVVSKSISVGEGRATYRGQVHIPKHLKGCKNNTECDALLINSNSAAPTPTRPSPSRQPARHPARGSASPGLRGNDLLHAAARPQRGPGDEPRRQRLHQRPRPRVPDGILRRTQAPHRPRNGRLDTSTSAARRGARLTRRSGRRAFHETGNPPRLRQVRRLARGVRFQRPLRPHRRQRRSRGTIEVHHWISGKNTVIFPHTLVVTGKSSKVRVD